VLNEVKDNTPIISDIVALSLGLASNGHLYLYSDAENQESVDSATFDKLHSFFTTSDSVGLLRLGLTHFSTALPPSISFWKQFSEFFIEKLCKQTSFEKESNQLPGIDFPLEQITQLINEAPFMRGLEYLHQAAMQTWVRLQEALVQELKFFDGNISAYLTDYGTAWNTVGKVCFHLAENKTNDKYPFAFLATYTTGLSKSAETQHLPLGRALEEYAENSKKSLLLALLLPIQKATERSLFLKNLVDNGKIFKPLAWQVDEAYQFLKDIPLFEMAGVMVRVPNWWNPKKPPRPHIKISVGEHKTAAIGLHTLLDFNMEFSLPSGEQITPQEFKKLLSTQQQLVQIKGQWVQVDNTKLEQVLSHWKNIEQQVKKEGLSFTAGLRLLAGVSNNLAEAVTTEEVAQWSTVVEGSHLQKILKQLRQPEIGAEKTLQTILQTHLKTELRAYQMVGTQWLWWLYNMRLGGCLADDMGLGKTVQVLSLLLLAKYKADKSQEPSPHLLILPSSLLDNWQTEIHRFAPSLRVWAAHSSVQESNPQSQPNLSQVDLVITTYAMSYRLNWLKKVKWDLIILDEAQAIKNPLAKQTHVIKELNGVVKFVLTGTPIENRLLDIWSLFDFVVPGLLGSHQDFIKYGKQKAQPNTNQGHFLTAIRRLVKPYILRRLKSDKNIISDLPDKTELQSYCTLTKQQAGLYQQTVNELSIKLQQPLDNARRRGFVLSYLLRFKQICNHPSQWLGHGHYDAEASGKFIRLKELCEIMVEKQEKVLVFTQFREIIPGLCHFLQDLFRKEGLFLHGQTNVKERAKRVEMFQKTEGPLFFILSLKAGGTGLNLTAASHVIHFDRWWNPSVENQATDRAYRIGQKKNVLVHKFICKGTIEEKIDDLIHSKKSLSEEIIGQSDEVSLTELSDKELLSMVALDIHRALGEN
jgi:non-specific serine/threonine protein kinase